MADIEATGGAPPPHAVTITGQPMQQQKSFHGFQIGSSKVSATMKDKLLALDANGDGSIDIDEVVRFVEAESKTQVKLRYRSVMLKAVAVLLIVVLGLNMGLTAAVVHLSKEVEVKDSTLRSVSGDTVKVASVDTHDSNGRLVSAGTNGTIRVTTTTTFTMNNDGTAQVSAAATTRRRNTGAGAVTDHRQAVWFAAFLGTLSQEAVDSFSATDPVLRMTVPAPCTRGQRFMGRRRRRFGRTITTTPTTDPELCGDLGSETNPAPSCAHLIHQGCGAGDFWIIAPHLAGRTASIEEADRHTLGKVKITCQADGFQLVAKLNDHDAVDDFSAAQWTHGPGLGWTTDSTGTLRTGDTDTSNAITELLESTDNSGAFSVTKDLPFWSGCSTPGVKACAIPVPEESGTFTLPTETANALQDMTETTAILESQDPAAALKHEVCLTVLSQALAGHEEEELEVPLLNNNTDQTDDAFSLYSWAFTAIMDNDPDFFAGTLNQWTQANEATMTPQVNTVGQYKKPENLHFGFAWRATNANMDHSDLFDPFPFANAGVCGPNSGAAFSKWPLWSGTDATADYARNAIAEMCLGPNVAKLDASIYDATITGTTAADLEAWWSDTGVNFPIAGSSCKTKKGAIGAPKDFRNHLDLIRSKITQGDATTVRNFRRRFWGRRLSGVINQLNQYPSQTCPSSFDLSDPTLIETAIPDVGCSMCEREVDAAASYTPPPEVKLCTTRTCPGGTPEVIHCVTNKHRWWPLKLRTEDDTSTTSVFQTTVTHQDLGAGNALSLTVASLLGYLRSNEPGTALEASGLNVWPGSRRIGAFHETASADISNCGTGLGDSEWCLKGRWGRTRYCFSADGNTEFTKCRDRRACSGVTYGFQVWAKFPTVDDACTREVQLQTHDSTDEEVKILKYTTESASHIPEQIGDFQRSLPQFMLYKRPSTYWSMIHHPDCLPAVVKMVDLLCEYSQSDLFRAHRLGAVSYLCGADGTGAPAHNLCKTDHRAAFPQPVLELLQRLFWSANAYFRETPPTQLSDFWDIGRDIPKFDLKTLRLW